MNRNSILEPAATDSPKLRALKAYLKDLSSSKHGIPTKKGRLNVEVISKHLNLSRQSFYKGRVSHDFFTLLEWALENLPHEERYQESDQESSDLKALRREILRVKSENHQLRSQLKALRALDSARKVGVELIV